MNNQNKDFFDQLRNLKIDNENFGNIICLFSKYLSVFNKDYKYNGTYLPEYINDFIMFKDSVNDKIDIYLQLHSKIKKIKEMKNYTLILDNTYRIHQYNQNKNNFMGENPYFNIDIPKIISDTIYVHFVIEVKKNNLLFYKEYDKKKYKGNNDKIYNQIVEDVKSFVEKSLEEKENEN